MIEQTTLLTYIVIVFGFVFIPGPATLLTVARATGSGARAGIATGAGIAVGDMIHTVMAVIGVSAIIATSAVLFGVVKYLGAAYLVYLGIRAFWERPATGTNAAIRSLSPSRAFRQAVLAEVLNPKTALFFLAFLPQFVSPEAGSVAAQLVILGAIFVALGLLSTILFAIGAGHLGQLLRRHPGVVRWQGKVVGGIYCALGLRLALQER